jgi:hypothetical protein
MAVAYVDYEYYDETYLGTAIAEADFPRLALRASAEIDRLTFERAGAVVEADDDEAVIDKIQMATCAIADDLQRSEDAGGQDNITSERTGNHSVSYGPKSSMSRSLEENVFESARLYLWNTGLMFKGLNADER